MKNSPNLESGSSNPRIFLGFILGFAGIFLALASVAMPNEAAPQAAASSSGARIYVTTTVPKIGPIGTGGCSLQEAIYSSVLHISFDGGAHGVAIDATNPDHFITTECVMGTGSGDTIVLPSFADFQFKSLLASDAYNYTGPTVTPIIFSTMTIEAYGATLEWKGAGNARLFAVGQATVSTPNGVVYGIGNLTLRNAYIKSFRTKGGDGAPTNGAGGGMGAGGAIYVHNATLTVENSTFDSNSAAGGNGATIGFPGGGGGLGGSGGISNPHSGAGGGGGGATGKGGTGGSSKDALAGAGGGGGGTNANGGNGGPDVGGTGGRLCGGTGANNDGSGHDALCAGGGGGGSSLTITDNGGNGNYGGGGGGGSGRGGNGGFGGGGGELAGNGGYGGGGGADNSSGVVGKGGAFAGNGSFSGGGGGAALGGAIFNDSGSVTVHNSTFTRNVVSAGLAGATNANDGVGAGAAIFSRNGALTIINTTISGNTANFSATGGGVVVHADGTSASFTLDNTILANNGSSECYLVGGVSATGVGNLIMSNGVGACPGVKTSVDPQLGALQPTSVDGKYTPTMPIPLYSSAMGVADPGTSISSDQRFADRPQPDSQGRNGYDIGALTVCRKYLVGLRYWACSETNLSPPPTTTLTMQVSSSSEGTTNPAAGTYTEDINTVVAIQAIPGSGYHFTGWTGNVAQPSNPSTTVTMSQAQTVTANFAAGPPSADLQITVTDGKSSAVAGAKNTYAITVFNAGPSYVTGAVIKDTFPSTFTGVTYSATQAGGATGFSLSGNGNINNTVTMPPGSSVTYTATGKLSAAANGSFTESATVSVPSTVTDPNLANNTATDSDIVTITADLSITVNDGKSSTLPGSHDTYTIVVTNLGPSNVGGVSVRDTFPSIFTGVTYTATQTGGASGFTASGSGNISDTVTMPTASKVTYKATGTISSSAVGTLSNTATVTSPSADPNTNNNSATDTDAL